MTRLSTRTRLGLLIAAMIGFHAGSALADQAICTSDNDCAAGEVCVAIPSACDDPERCAQGEAYCMEEGSWAMPTPPAACTSDADCENDGFCYAWDDEYSSCLPSWMTPCAMDSECSTDFRCLPIDGGGGHGGGHDGGWAEPAPAPEEIPPSEGSGSDGATPPPDFRAMELPTFCLPTWAGPCEVDADCGEGFRCVEETYEICQGGGASPGSPGDAPDVPQDFREETECTTETTGDYFCDLIEVPCASDNDCLNGWTCEAFGGGDAVCTSTPDGDAFCEEPEDAESFCFPPYAMDLIDALGGGFAESDASLGEHRPGSPDRPGSGAPGDDDFNAPPRAADADGGGGGCTVAPTRGSGALGATLLLGILGLLRRRDQR